MDRAEAENLLATARVGRLATLGPTGAPHIVPITFAVVSGTVVHMVDHKPKTTRHLTRLRNLERDPRASVLVDHYVDDWAALWWVRVDGTARVLADGPEVDRARAALVAKYAQYRETPPQGPAVLISVDEVRWWAGAE
jgi:PPOX class probable F420-dependent enzyme